MRPRELAHGPGTRRVDFRGYGFPRSVDWGMPSDSIAVAQRSRKSIVNMCSASGAAHVGSSLSVVDILAVLYGGAANVDPMSISDPERDLVVLSKGHAAAALYAVLGNLGFFPSEWLETYCQNGSRLGGHVSSGQIPGVEFSTGSLGHGLPFGAGVAFARQRRGLEGFIFVILSDGECDEGSIWEAALFAAHHELGNLIAIIDRNRLQSLGSTETTLRLEPLASKWRSFGWNVLEVDGHDHDAIRVALSTCKTTPTVPSIVICNTTKGKGVSFMENSVMWHYRSPSTEEALSALLEIGRDSGA